VLDPRFLDLAEALEVHLDQIERYGGAAGIRDLALLQSAVAMPRAGIGGVYAHDSLFEMAAAYLFHVARNHPFVDGNKRTGASSAEYFVERNGLRLVADDEEFEELTLAVAEGKVEAAELAIWFRQRLRRVD
jgi:death-on-curing protein